MTTALTTTQQTTALQYAGQVANEVAAQSTFARYQALKSDNTKAAQLSDLARFAEFLRIATNGATTYAGTLLRDEPAAWAGVTWGTVEAFKAWMLNRGYSIATVNRALTTVKVYAGLAAQAGTISADDLTMIRTVKGNGGKEAKRLDDARPGNTRIARAGAKKAAHVSLTDDQARDLMTGHPATAQGMRDAVIMCLLLDHGLRVGELVLLQVPDFDMKAGTFAFYRPKVDQVQTHKMTPRTKHAIATWLASGNAPTFPDDAGRVPLLRGSRKGGTLTADGATERGVSKRVQLLGKRVGVEGLSPHDCRHYWATYHGKRCAKGKATLFQLQEAGGWASLIMPRRYVEAAKIANEGMLPDDDESPEYHDAGGDGNGTGSKGDDDGDNPPPSGFDPFQPVVYAGHLAGNVV